MTEITRLPGEPLVKFYNRRIQARGDRTKEWYQDSGGRLRLRDRVNNQRDFDLGDQP